jgi:hypothetical protein
VLHNLLGEAASIPADAERVKLDHTVEAAKQTRTGSAPAVLTCGSPVGLSTILSTLSDVQRARTAAGSLLLCFLLAI